MRGNRVRGGNRAGHESVPFNWQTGRRPGTREQPPESASEPAVAGTQSVPRFSAPVKSRAGARGCNRPHWGAMGAYTPIPFAPTLPHIPLHLAHNVAVAVLCAVQHATWRCCTGAGSQNKPGGRASWRELAGCRALPRGKSVACPDFSCRRPLGMLR